MNNVLNEFTYCDARVENGSRMALADTPARLKVRKNTFQGIYRSIDRRRKPTERKMNFNAFPNAFAIPAAAMPTMTSDDEDGTVTGGSHFTIIDGGKDPHVLRSPIDAKKLRILPAQKQAVATNGKKASVYRPFQEEAKTEISEEVVPTVTVQASQEPLQQVEVQAVAPSVSEVIPQVEEKQAISLDDIDKVRQKAYTQTQEMEQPVAEATMNRPVEEPEVELTEFARLQKATKEYTDVVNAFEEAKERLNEQQDRLATTKKELAGIEEDIVRGKNQIIGQQESIANAQKDAKAIEKEIQETRQNLVRLEAKINRKKEETLLKKRNTEKKEQEVIKEISNVGAKIGEGKGRLESIAEEQQRLSQKETEELKKLAEQRAQLGSLKEIINAITLPEGLSLDESKQNDSISSLDDYKNRRVDKFSSLEGDGESLENTDFDLEETYQKTLGRAA